MPVNYESRITNTKLLFLLFMTPHKMGVLITFYLQHLKTYALTNEHTNKHISHVNLITFDVHNLLQFRFSLTTNRTPDFSTVCTANSLFFNHRALQDVRKILQCFKTPASKYT